MKGRDGWSGISSAEDIFGGTQLRLARLNPVNSAAEASNSTGFALAIHEQGRGLRQVVSHPLR